MASSSGWQARRSGVPVSDLTSVLENCSVKSAIGGQPSLDPLEVGVCNGSGRRTHHFVQGIVKCILFELDTDGRHFGRPFPVAETSVDDLAMQSSNGVTVLAVVPGDCAALVLLSVLRHRQGQWSLGLTIRQVVAVGNAGRCRAMCPMRNRLRRQHAGWDFSFPISFSTDFLSG